MTMKGERFTQVPRYLIVLAIGEEIRIADVAAPDARAAEAAVRKSIDNGDEAILLLVREVAACLHTASGSVSSSA